jgi:hypothetical protein
VCAGTRQAVPHRFSPRAIEVAHFLIRADVEGDTADFLAAIDRRWPGLSFRDFWGAYVLADALTWKAEGKA